MLNTYTTDTQSLDTDDLVVFDVNGVIRGCSAKHTAGSSSVYLTVPGYYLVTFNGTAKADEDATSTTDYVCFQLYQNDSKVEAAEAATATSEDGLKNDYTFTTIVKVLPSCPAIDNTAELTVKNIGLASSLVNVALTVVKL